MDIQKERKAFDVYFKEKYPELYKDVFDEDGDDRAIIGYSFAWSAWQAAKAQAVPEGFVLVPREMPKSFDEGLYVYSNSISIVDECSDGFIPMSDINHAEVWKLVIEAQEQSHDNSN